MKDDSQATEVIDCSKCRRKTNHKVLGYVENRSEPGEDLQWTQQHYLAQCAGCEAYCYAIHTFTEEDYDPGAKEQVGTWQVFPPASDGRSLMDYYEELPQQVFGIYQEVVGAINAELSLVAAIGLRTLIESICIERKVSSGNLQKSIDELASDGVLASKQTEVLHKIRFLGNIAAHQIREAQPGELLAALEIAESMLKTIYVVPVLATQVSTGQPTPKTNRRPLF